MNQITNNYSKKPLGFMRLREVLELLPFGKSTWWDGVKEGRFPKAIKLSPRVTAWKREDIYSLIEELSNQEGGSNA